MSAPPGAAAAPAGSASRSRLTIRPPGPEPRRARRSSPFSCAILRARGEDLILPPDGRAPRAPRTRRRVCEVPARVRGRLRRRRGTFGEESRDVFPGLPDDGDQISRLWPGRPRGGGSSAECLRRRTRSPWSPCRSPPHRARRRWRRYPPPSSATARGPLSPSSERGRS